MVVAGQFIVAPSGAHEESAHYPSAAKILQDPVDRHLIDPLPGANCFYNLLGPEGTRGSSKNLQDRQAHRSGPQAFLG